MDRESSQRIHPEVALVTIIVGDDDRPCKFEICRIGRNNASRESLESFPFDGTLMGQLWGME